MKKRGVISDKEELEQRVKALAKDCPDLSTLKQKLIENDIEPYARGKEVLTGAWIGSRKFRLTSLGVSKEHFKAMRKEEERLLELRKKSDTDKSKDHEK